MTEIKDGTFTGKHDVAGEKIEVGDTLEMQIKQLGYEKNGQFYTGFDLDNGSAQRLIKKEHKVNFVTQLQWDKYSAYIDFGIINNQFEHTLVPTIKIIKKWNDL